MNFNQFLLVLKARKKVILITLLLTVATTLIVSLVLPKTYTASTTVVINAKGYDPVTQMTLPYQLTPGYLATQVGIIGSDNVALRVVQGLGLEKIPVLQEAFQKEDDGKGNIQNYIADLLLKHLIVDPSRTSNLVDISYQAGNPQFAAAIANAFAQAYIQTNLDLRTQPAQQTTAWLDQQIKQLRDNLRNAQDKLSQYQQQHGLVLSDERMDVQTQRLADLSSQLVMAQATSFDATSRQKERADLPDVINNPLVQALTPQVVQLDSKLADLGKKVGPNNPEYQSTLAQRNVVKKQLDDAIRAAQGSITATAQASQTRVADLQAAMAEQKAKVLEVKKERDQAALLQQDVDAAKLAFENAMQRLSQSSLEAKSVQTDISILNQATPPIKPSSPKVLLNTVLAIFLGGMLGIGFGFLLEAMDRRVRSIDDIQEHLGLPVLNTTFGKPRALTAPRRSLLPFKTQSA